MKHAILIILVLAGISAKAQLQNDTNRLGNISIIFQQKCSNIQPGISWVHVHENEATAIAAAHAMIDSQQNGCVVSWIHSGDRYVSFSLTGKNFKFDPNRIFTPKGLELSLKANGAFTKKAFITVQDLANHFIEKYVANNKLIVALHNNTDGGGLHIKSYLPGGEYANDAAEVFVNEKADIDDFFYTTDKRIFDFLKAKGFNILLQNNQTVTDDGSLSVYCGTKGMAYLNIEAQHGHMDDQKKMMRAVYDMVNTLFQ